jgi:hypothetical protein
MTMVYENYTGPELTKATLNDKDITERIKELYSLEKNWHQRLYTWDDIEENIPVHSTLYIEYKRKNGHVDYCKMEKPSDPKFNIWNGPLYSPFCEKD